MADFMGSAPEILQARVRAEREANLLLTPVPVVLAETPAVEITPAVDTEQVGDMGLIPTQLSEVVDYLSSYPDEDLKVIGVLLDEKYETYTHDKRWGRERRIESFVEFGFTIEHIQSVMEAV